MTISSESDSSVTIPALPISNLGAVANMVRKCGGEPNITSDPNALLSSKRAILAGVGSFDAGMRSLHEGGWIQPLNELAANGNIPVLGICLGMQLMCRKSEEGNLPGLGWFDADVNLITSHDQHLKVPHMGWNTIRILKPDPLLPLSSVGQRFYFVHSYHVVCDNPQDILATSFYGQNLTAAISCNMLFGTQFHPEKSHRFGKEVISNFLDFPLSSILAS